MGLKFKIDAFYAFIAEQLSLVLLQKQSKGGAADKGAQVIRLNSATLPEEHKIDCVLSDITSDMMNWINAWKQNSLGVPGHPEIIGVLASEVVDRQKTILKSLLAIPSLSTVRNWVFLIDTPQDVPKVKAVEHAERRKDPYLDSDLRSFAVLVPSPSGDGFVISPTFVSDSIWATDLQRLHSTKMIKPLLGRFFAESIYRGTCEVKSDKKINVYFEGAWPESGMVKLEAGVGRNLEANKWNRHFSSLSCSTPGEADTKVLHYINPFFGKSFLIRSVDGDFQCILLLYYLRLLHQGVSQDQLPKVWIDRTSSGYFASNVDKETRYFNCYGMFMAICQLSGVGTIETAKDLVRITSVILSTASLIMFRGCDFTENFEEAFFDREAAKKTKEAKKGGTENEKVPDPMDTCLPSAVEIVNSSTKPDKPQRRVAKKAGTGDGVRLPGKFSEKKLLEKLYISDDWRYKCFSAKYDPSTQLFDVKLECDFMKKLMVKKLELEHKCNEERFILNCQKLTMTLEMWFNSHINTFRDAMNVNDVPSQYFGLQLARGSNKPMYGYRMVPCDPVENSTLVFHIDKGAVELRERLFDKNDKLAANSEYFKVL